MPFHITSTRLLSPVVEDADDHVTKRIAISFVRFTSGETFSGSETMVDYDDMLVLKHGSSAIAVVDDLRQLADRIEYSCIK